MRALRELEARAAQADLDHAGVFGLILAATGSRDRAEKAAFDFLAAELRAGRTPGGV